MGRNTHLLGREGKEGVNGYKEGKTEEREGRDKIWMDGRRGGWMGGWKEGGKEGRKIRRKE